MKKTSLLFVLVFCTAFCSGQDIFTRGLVYQAPAMKNVQVKENLTYYTANDTALRFDIYYPPGFAFKQILPLVIFNNGVGSMDLPRWGIYKDWTKLVAANGLIAINHQSRSSKALQDNEALVDYLLQHGKELNIDTGKIGIWTCSANARTGMRLSYKTRPAAVKALVVYYGPPDSLGQLRQDLPTLMVRAGLDAQFLNTGIDNFVQSSLQQDTRLEVINYVNGIHAFDAYTASDEAKDIIVRTVGFLKKHLTAPVTNHAFILTNKNFMWLVMNNQTATAAGEFRKARTMYRADSSFHPFYNAVIREDVLNANAYWLLNNGRPTDALELFKLAVETYPESPNAYESLSEAYEMTGNKAEAVRNAEICLQKLPAATGMNEAFKQRVKEGAEERIKRLRSTNTSSQLSLPPKRAHHELVYDEGRKAVLLTAGSTPLNGGQSFAFYNDLWQFDGKTWKQVGTAGDERSGIRMAYDTKRAKLFSFGGYANNNSLGDLRLLENGEWKILSNDTAMRAAEAGFVYDEARDKLVAFGGSPRRGVLLGTTWEWNGSSWKALPATGPEGRVAFAMAYDTRRKKTVFFGGLRTDVRKEFNDTWEYDGKQWLLVDTSGPAKRASPGYAYDSKRGQLVIFGGASAAGMLGDTWAWDGKAWRFLSDKGPSPRAMGYMAYDKGRDRIVLFGGRTGWPNDVNDTWEWDGKEWMEIK